MSIANKMSLSAPSDKAKRQGPSSCHVLAGAWGKTPSGAGKYFPNRHTRKHRFHQMVKSAVATACMLACLCQIATASRKAIDYDRVIIDEVRKYIQKNESVMGIDQINDEQLNSILLEGQVLNEGGDITWCKLRWKNEIKTKINTEFSGIFEERRQEAADKAARIAREEALRAEAQRREAQRESEERKAEEQLKTKATAAVNGLTDEVFEHILTECVDGAAKDQIAANEERVRAANKEICERRMRRELNDIFLQPFNVFKKNERGKNGKMHQFHFNTYSNVFIQDREKLDSFLPTQITIGQTSRCPREGPVISYKNGKSVIIVFGLEKDQEATLPQGIDNDEYHGCCYKVSGSFLEQNKKNVWRFTQREFLRFWIPREYNKYGDYLETWYASLQN